MAATTITVNDESPRRQYTATAGQTVFDFPIPFFEEGDLTVYLTPAGNTPSDSDDLLTITTDYTVNGEDTQDGGEIVLTSGATAGDVITIERIVPIERTSDYQTAGDLLAETLNTEQDTEIFIAQQLRQDIQRAILFGKTSTTQGAQFVGDPSEGKALLWNADGNLINSTNNFNSIVPDAEAAKTAAETAQSGAETAEVGAVAAQSYAEEWANKAEDSLVSAAAGGDEVDDFSALHWSKKAEAAVANIASANVDAISDLAALDTSLYDSAVVAEEVGTDPLWIKVDVSGGAYAALRTADTTNGVIIDSTFDADFAWLRAAYGRYINVKWFGAVADGVDSLDAETDGGNTVVKGDWATSTAYAIDDLVWEASSGTRLGYRCVEAHTSGTFATDLSAGKWVVGAFSGTDNTTAFQNALTIHEIGVLPLYVPKGNYRCINPTTTVDDPYLTLTASNFKMFGEGTIFLDEDLTTGKNYNFFKGDNVATSTDKRERQRFEIDGLRFRGRWSHQPGGNTGTGARAHVFYVSEYEHFRMTNCVFEDIAGSVSRIRTCDTVLCKGNEFYRVAKGAARFLDCNDVKVIGNSFKYTDDDSIDCHANNNQLRTSVTITGNTLFNCEGIIALGARNTACSDNVLFQTHGTQIYLGGRVSDEGDNAALNITCTGNTILDPFTRSNDGSTLANNDSNIGAITVAGVPSSYQSGSWTGSAVRDPLQSGSYIYENIDLDTTNVASSQGVTVSGNTVQRITPTQTAYSDMSRGFYFHEEGWIDPAIALENWVRHGISVFGDMHNFTVIGNTVSGFREGAGVWLHSLQTTDSLRVFSFRNGNVSNNTIRDVQFGITHSRLFNAATPEPNIDVSAVGNDIDCDPYQVSSARTDAVSGTWNTGAAVGTRVMGIALAANAQGSRIIGNKIKNCWEALYGVTTSYDSAFFADNNLHCEPQADGVSASNIGICRVIPSGPEVIYTIVKSAPNAASYDQVNNHCLRSGSSVPTTGRYVTGHEFVVNMLGATTNDRYRRATTGNSHSVGTDWIAF